MEYSRSLRGYIVYFDSIVQMVCLDLQQGWALITILRHDSRGQDCNSIRSSRAGFTGRGFRMHRKTEQTRLTELGYGYRFLKPFRSSMCTRVQLGIMYEFSS